jgi:predicted PurR-regulated permease PerM
MTTLEVLCLVIVVLVLVFSIIGSILLYNFMQLLSTINKRMMATIGDILGNIQFETPNINAVTDKEEIPTAGYSQLLEDEDIISEGFNPHNYDPYAGDSE